MRFFTTSYTLPPYGKCKENFQSSRYSAGARWTFKLKVVIPSNGDQLWTPEAIVRSLWNWTRHVNRRPVLPGVHTLLVSASENYRGQWQRIFDNRGWGLELAATLKDALRTLRNHSVPVVVYDMQSGEEDWREAVRALRELPHRPCILLVSSVIDERFRDELVRLHGYDALSRQADEDEIARTINSAWFWKNRHA